MSLRVLAAKILGVDPARADILIELRRGARTIGLFATPAGLAHGFGASRQVLVKLYKGDGSTAGNEEYRTYHGLHFQRTAAMTGNPHIQQSLAAGIDCSSGVPHPYAILEYIPGMELADIIEAGRLTVPEAIRIFDHIMMKIWIPLWSAGLRFKDCHPGNFIVQAGGSVFMIDTEQIRKDVAEFLHTPECWQKRDRHEELGIQRLPGLIVRLIRSARPDCKEGTMDREVRRLLADIRMPAHLHGLGRGGADAEARGAAQELAERLARMWG